MQVLGDNIRYFRNKKNMSQQFFADNIKFSKDKISAFENNKRIPNIADFVKICDLLNVSADILLGLSSNKKYPGLQKDKLSTKNMHIRKIAEESEEQFAKK